MNYKNLFIIIFIFFLVGCEQYNLNKKDISYKSSDKYKNSGFALVYKNTLKDEKKFQKKLITDPY